MTRCAVLIPVYEPSEKFPELVRAIRREMSRNEIEVPILIVNDGCSSAADPLFAQVADLADVTIVRHALNLGKGAALKTGINAILTRRPAIDVIVTADGDGQHRACDIVRLLTPVVSGRADAALGSRFLHRRRDTRGLRRLSQALLAACLSTVTRRSVTDPTSGFWLFGPRALRVLSGHHPAGYAEPELLLFLSRNSLRVTEVPIRMRPRIAGRTSLTMPRTLLALARTALAFVVVPFRRLVEGQAHD